MEVAPGEPGHREARRRVGWPVGRIVALVLLVLLVVWLAFAGRFLVSADADPSRADAVVALSGDPLGDRLAKAAEVFTSTGSGRLVAFVDAGEVYDQRAAAHAYLEGRGIDPSAIRLIPSGASTADEAAAIGALADRCGWGSVDVVTSPYHTRRAGWLVARSTDAEVTTVASDEPFVSGAWFTDGPSSEEVFLEWTKLVSSVRYLFTSPDVATPDVAC